MKKEKTKKEKSKGKYVIVVEADGTPRSGYGWESNDPRPDVSLAEDSFQVTLSKEDYYLIFDKLHMFTYANGEFFLKPEYQ